MIRALSSYPCKLNSAAILATLPEKLVEQVEQEKFREYIAECARMTTKAAAQMVGGEFIDMKFNEFIHPKPVDNRSGEEIAADVINKLGLEVD